MFLRDPNKIKNALGVVAVEDLKKLAKIEFCGFEKGDIVMRLDYGTVGRVLDVFVSDTTGSVLLSVDCPLDQSYRIHSPAREYQKAGLLGKLRYFVLHWLLWGNA